ncbi:MAG TPA: RNA polymerase sigma factor [Clostridiales bacterium]|nr:RNA polymerase sigma factor [Clostridiales bacterium]
METIESLYRQYRRPVFTYLYGLTHNVHAAEDLTQETFLQVIRSIPTFRGDSKVTTWIFGIARNLYRKWAGMNRNGAANLDLMCIDLPDIKLSNLPDRMLELKETSLTVHRILAQLPEHQKELIILRDWHGMSYDDIARIMGKSLSWVKVNIYRSRTEFRNKYNRLEDLGNEK